jgi:NADPH2:quinone reductase
MVMPSASATASDRVGGSFSSPSPPHRPGPTPDPGDNLLAASKFRRRSWLVDHRGRSSALSPHRSNKSISGQRAMRAIVCRQWGKVDDLVLGDAPMPQPGAGELLIRVAASAVNYADAIMVAGRYQTKPELPFSPGLEAAGVVAACGPDVTGFVPGDRVMAILAYGGLAEYAVAPAAESWIIPAGMSFAEAGAFPIAYISSHVALRWQGRLDAGETLLVLGAAGGVGLTAIEIGKAMGARVIAAASTPDKLAVAAAHGADATIDYAKEPLTERVMALTGGKGADVCFDPVGGPLFDAALSSLGWGGRILLIGFVGGVPQIPANRLLVKHRAALGSSLRYFRWHAPDKLVRSVNELFGWYGADKLKPCISHRLPLERTVEALHLLTERRAHGKVVVELEAA